MLKFTNLEESNRKYNINDSFNADVIEGVAIRIHGIIGREDTVYNRMFEVGTIVWCTPYGATMGEKGVIMNITKTSVIVQPLGSDKIKSRRIIKFYNFIWKNYTV